ncbi:MAG: Cof-type HAD-IIB family hydrolase [Liquorilactobacillus ghanensis]|uniref:Cof-type HAD-IIB family hydrolase n=1 Tax=Liquorilactobacillus ghanensis TaxID=399370 RepID=UPI0039E73690
MEQKLIALDLDGTTLNAKSMLTVRTKLVLEQAKQAGHIVSIVTGRPYRISANYYDELHLKTPMINFNGALGHIPHHQWNKEYQKTFSREVVFDLLTHKNELGIKVIAAEAKDTLLVDQPQDFHSEFFPNDVSKQQALTKDSLKNDPAAATLMIETQKEATTAAWIKEKYHHEVAVGVWGGPAPVIELEPQGISKAFGLAYLADSYHIKRQNIIAFGDEHNDREMLEYAGLGVAMKNGTDNIKKIANDITKFDNQHDGLANYLVDYLQLAK